MGKTFTLQQGKESILKAGIASAKIFHRDKKMPGGFLEVGL